MAGPTNTEPRRNRWLWIGLAAPGAIWLIVLFVVPFYVMLAVAGGGVNEFFQTVVPIWNPIHWSSWNLSSVWHDIFGSGAFIGSPALRTVIYTAIATVMLVASFLLLFLINALQRWSELRTGKQP